MLRILCATRTVDFRAYGWYPISVGFADAVLVIQNGVPGPRGGMSKCSIRSYWVDECPRDPTLPTFAHVGKVFLLAKREGHERYIEDIEHPEECVYRVHVRPVAGSECTCTGFRGHGICKHADAVEDHVRQLEGSVVEPRWGPGTCPYCGLPCTGEHGHPECEEREQLEMAALANQE